MHQREGEVKKTVLNFHHVSNKINFIMEEKNSNIIIIEEQWQLIFLKDYVEEGEFTDNNSGIIKWYLIFEFNSYLKFYFIGSFSKRHKKLIFLYKLDLS